MIKCWNQIPKILFCYQINEKKEDLRQFSKKSKKRRFSISSPSLNLQMQMQISDATFQAIVFEGRH